MKHHHNKYLAVILLLAAVQAFTASAALARAAAFSFDSVWFYRDGTKVVPEISKRWLTVVFDSRYVAKADEFASTSDTADGFIQKKARSIVKSHDRLRDFLYDPNIAEDACFFRLRDGLNLEDVKKLIDQLSQDGTVRYVHPTLVMDNKTLAFFNSLELEWKTGIAKAQREQLLGAAHAVIDEKDAKEKRYTVDVRAIPFFRALNLLAEDVRVLRVTPYLVEVKPSITARLSLFMSGGNIGDSVPFSLTITFSDRVSIDPSSIATLNLRPPEIQKELFDCVFDPYDYAKAVTKNPIVITGHVRFYAPGEFTIPPVKISYSCPSCSDNPTDSVRSIDTEPALFKVSSIIPAEKSQIRLIVPTEPVSADFHLAELHRQSLRYLWLAVIAFAALVPCAVRLLLLRRKAGAERRRHREKKRDGQLAERLRMLLKETPAAPHWTYLGEVGKLLREYMAALYGIDTKYKGGSRKKFMETIAAHLPGECIAPLGSALAVIDNSVALETEHYQDIEQLQSDILKIVDLTAQNGGQG